MVLPEEKAGASPAGMRTWGKEPSREELGGLDYRSKKELEGQVRIITIHGSDVCACCGTHVKRTGQIGPIKAVASEHYKTGIRISLQIGWKALEDYEEKHRNIKE